MTYEEALKAIDKFCVGCGNTDDCENCEYPSLVKALNKQIPQKPKDLTVEYSKEHKDTVRSGYCPTCGRYLCEWKQHKSDHYFCEKCGQSVAWGWEE